MRRRFGSMALLGGVATLLGVGSVGAGAACQAYDADLYASETSDASTAPDAQPVGDSGDRGDTGDASDDSSVIGPTTLCAQQDGGEPCTTIPLLTKIQNVDGSGDEFCGVPFFTFLLANGSIPAPATIADFPTSLPVLTLQVAWAASGLAIFAHVAEPNVAPADPSQAIYQGDALELFVAASSASLTGNESGDPGAFHFIASPPPATMLDGGIGYEYLTNAGGTPPIATIPGSDFVTRRVTDGYDIELLIRWSLFDAGVPMENSVIGFDVGLDVNTSGVPADRMDAGVGALQSFLYVRPDAATPPTACDEPEPYCDDRTWCTPQLAQ